MLGALWVIVYVLGGCVFVLIAIKDTERRETIESAIQFIAVWPILVVAMVMNAFVKEKP